MGEWNSLGLHLETARKIAPRIADNSVEIGTKI
jgi:hypothetical protein